MQVYKYFDIGTAKLSREARERVTHHLIDILEPDQEFTAFDFKTRALALAREMAGRNKIPILVGGTGLYLKVLTQNYDCAVQVSPEIRERVKLDIRTRGTEALHAELARVDASYAARILPTDPLRIERALTVYYQTGKRFSDFHVAEASTEPEFDIYYFVFEEGRKRLYQRIDQRVDEMIEKGLAGEVKQLLDRGFGKNLKPLQSIGYAQMVNHLEGNITLDRAIYEIKRDTRHYAKRQVTWFKKVPGAIPVVVEADDTPLTLRDRIMSLLPIGLSLPLCIFSLLVFTGVAQAGSLTYEDGIKFFSWREYPKAMRHFQVVSRTAPETQEGKRALYLMGKTYAAMQEPNEALEVFKAFDYPEIKDYIHFDMAEIYFGLQEYALAFDEITRLLEKFPQSCLLPQAELLRADILSKLDRNEQATRFLTTVIERFSKKPPDSTSAQYIPLMIFKSALLKEQSRQTRQALSLYRDLYINYPNHEVMSKALPNFKQLSAGSFPPSLTEEEFATRVQNLLTGVQYQQAIDEIGEFKKQTGKSALSPRFYFYLASAYKSLRQRAQANEALLAFLKEYPKHQRIYEADYLIARNLWNLNQNESSIRYFQDALRAGPDSEWFLKAQFYLGRLYEDNNQYPQAMRQYEILAKLPRQHEYKEISAWRLAWIQYKMGNLERSFELFKNNVNNIPNGQLTDSNIFWMGKAAEKLGRDAIARNIYADLYKTYPFAYYGLRAREKLLEVGLPAEEPAIENDIELNLPPLSPEEFFHYVRAREMTTMGFNENARIEIQQIEKTYKKNLSGVVWVANLYNRATAYSGSFRILSLYKDLKAGKGEKELPLLFWKSLYPSAYSESIQMNAKNQKIDPFLVKGVIHQESMFDAKALSPAGARGLMQLMPETGRRLALDGSGQKTFAADSLFDPDLNIQLGVKYLGELNQQTGNNAVHILICYNAGPDVLKKWLLQFQSLTDPDEFIESIPYPETRGYVKHILRNYGVYKSLYPNASEEWVGNNRF